MSHNITSEADIQKLEKAVKDNWGHTDVLANNSGQWGGKGNIEELNVKAWWRLCYQTPSFLLHRNAYLLKPHRN